jgi:hypothetical protein
MGMQCMGCGRFVTDLTYCTLDACSASSLIYACVRACDACVRAVHLHCFDLPRGVHAVCGCGGWRSEAAGMDGYLMKPPTRHKLRALLVQYLNARRTTGVRARFLITRSLPPTLSPA